MATKTAHAEYLQTEHWQQLRKRFLDEYACMPWGMECSRCDMPRWLAAIAYDQDLHAHHKSYAHIGTEEEIDDLEALCRRCHELETFGRSDLRAPKTATCSTCGAKHYDVFCDKCKFCTSFSLPNIEIEILQRFNAPGTGWFGFPGKAKKATLGDVVIGEWLKLVGTEAALDKLSQLEAYLTDWRAHRLRRGTWSQARCAPEFNCRFCKDEECPF